MSAGHLFMDQMSDIYNSSIVGTAMRHRKMNVESRRHSVSEYRSLRSIGRI